MSYILLNNSMWKFFKRKKLMYLYYNTLFEKKQPFFVRKFKILILFSPFRYNHLIFAQEKVSIFVNFFLPLVVDKT